MLRGQEYLPIKNDEISAVHEIFYSKEKFWAVSETDASGQQLMFHSSPWLAAAWAPGIAHINHFYCFYQKYKSSDFKVKLSHTSNRLQKCSRNCQTCVC